MPHNIYEVLLTFMNKIISIESGKSTLKEHELFVENEDEEDLD